MPRNGSGSYTLPTPPTPFVTGTTANATDVNTVNNDLAAALTDSVAADGQTPMTGNLNMNTHNITNGGTVSATFYQLNGSSIAAYLRGYISGLTLSNDGTSPNTVLDISAGIAIDSTNSIPILLLSAFTKTTGGAWTAGTGNAGMGAGLTIANNTWYHVFAIINAGTTDVYFDTSPTAANAPGGTSVFRRIGSFKTNGSAQILGFVQNGNRFDWKAPISELSNVTPGTTTQTLTLAGAPTGIAVEAIMSWLCLDSVAAPTIYVSSLAQTDLAPSGTNFTFGGSVNVIATLGGFRVITDTIARIRYRSFQSTTAVTSSSQGWIDTRGRFA